MTIASGENVFRSPGSAIPNSNLDRHLGSIDISTSRPKNKTTTTTTTTTTTQQQHQQQQQYFLSQKRITFKTMYFIFYIRTYSTGISICSSSNEFNRPII